MVPSYADAPAGAPVSLNLPWCSEHGCYAEVKEVKKPDSPNIGRQFIACPNKGCQTVKFTWTDGRPGLQPSSGGAPAAIPHDRRAPGGPVPGADFAALQSMQLAIERLEANGRETRRDLDGLIQFSNQLETDQVDLGRTVHTNLEKIGKTLTRVRAFMVGKAQKATPAKGTPPRVMIPGYVDDSSDGEDQ